MALARTAWTDDDGTGTTGTILNNAEKVTLYNQIDARWSESGISNVGTVNNLDFLEADSIRAINASLATYTGLLAPASPAKPGKRLLIYNAGAADVDLDNESVSSTAANRIITGFNGTIKLVAGLGRAILTYDDLTSDRWRVIQHEQGQVAAYTPVWTASGTAPALGNGTLTGQYYVRGKQVQFHLELVAGSTTTFGTGSYSFTLPFTAALSPGYAFPAFIQDTGTTTYAGVGTPNSTTTFLITVNAGVVGQLVPHTWATTDVLRVSGTYYVA